MKTAFDEYDCSPAVADRFTALGVEAHNASASSGWWSNPDGSPKERNRGEMFALMMTELAEMHRGLRALAMDEHLPQHTSALVEAGDFYLRVGDFMHGFGGDLGTEMLPLTIGAEMGVVGAMVAVCDAVEADRKGRHPEVFAHLARACLIVHSFARAFLGATTEQQIAVAMEKSAYNRQRADHKLANRMKEGGKGY